MSYSWDGYSRYTDSLEVSFLFGMYYIYIQYEHPYNRRTIKDINL
jgi:hypothetical protein